MTLSESITLSESTTESDEEGMESELDHEEE